MSGESPRPPISERNVIQRERGILTVIRTVAGAAFALLVTPYYILCTHKASMI